MLKSLDPHLSSKSGGTLSNEIISLVYTVKKEILAKKGADIT